MIEIRVFTVYYRKHSDCFMMGQARDGTIWVTCPEEEYIERCNVFQDIHNRLCLARDGEEEVPTVWINEEDCLPENNEDGSLDIYATGSCRKVKDDEISDDMQNDMAAVGMAPMLGTTTSDGWKLAPGWKA